MCYLTIPCKKFICKNINFIKRQIKIYSTVYNVFQMNNNKWVCLKYFLQHNFFK